MTRAKPSITAAIKSIADGVFGGISQAFGAFTSISKGFGAAIGGIFEGFSGLARGVSSIVGGVVSALGTVISTIASGAMSVIGGVFNYIQQGFEGMQKGMLGVAALVTALGGAFLTAGVAGAAEFEQTTIAFETMMGSAEKAAALLGELRVFAAKTPFELPGILGATRSLMSFGLETEQVMPTINMLGDIAAGTGKDLRELSVIFGQIRSAERLMGQDLMQLINAGVPIMKILKEETGLSGKAFKKFQEDGNISFEMVEKAFKKMTAEGGIFFNLMQRQSESLKGLASTLKDNLAELAMVIGGPLASSTKMLTTLSITLVGNLTEIAKRLPDVTAGLFQGALAAASLVTALAGARVAMNLLGMSFTGMFLGGALATAIIVIGAAIGAAAGGLKMYISHLMTLAPVQAAIAKLTEKLGEAMANLRTAFTYLKIAAAEALDAILDRLMKMFGVTAVGDFETKVVDTVTSITGKIGDFVVKASEMLVNLVKRWEDTWYAIKLGAETAWSAVKDVVNNTITGISNIAVGIWANIVTAWQEGKAMLVAVWEGLKGALPAVLDVFVQLAISTMLSIVDVFTIGFKAIVEASKQALLKITEDSGEAGGNAGAAFGLKWLMGYRFALEGWTAKAIADFFKPASEHQGVDPTILNKAAEDMRKAVQANFARPELGAALGVLGEKVGGIWGRFGEDAVGAAQSLVRAFTGIRIPKLAEMLGLSSTTEWLGMLAEDAVKSLLTIPEKVGPKTIRPPVILGGMFAPAMEAAKAVDENKALLASLNKLPAFVGFADYGKEIQKSILKGGEDPAKKTAENTGRAAIAAEQSKKIQEDILTETKKKTGTLK